MQHRSRTGSAQISVQSTARLGFHGGPRSGRLRAGGGRPGRRRRPPGRSGGRGPGFGSSFEAGEPAPDWLNTVDTAPDGTKRSSGVDGGFSAGIPGNVTDHVADVRASGENTGGGEVKENLVDVEPSTKWLTFEPTGWVEFDLDAPVKVVTYALTSANDHDERDPDGLDPPGLHGRQGLEDPRHPHR